MTRVWRKNVYLGPLHIHSEDEPKTGVLRDGFCEVPESDEGNHSIAASVTAQFLDFSASRGNDLRKQVGLKPGDKWCLCASRWKEAFDARTGKDDEKVPPVHLHATNAKALDVVSFKDLKAFAAKPPNDMNEQHPAVSSDHPDAMVKTSQSIGGKEPRA